MKRQSTYTLYLDSNATDFSTQAATPAKALTALAAAAGLELATKNGRFGKLTDGRNASALTNAWGRAHYRHDTHRDP